MIARTYPGHGKTIMTPHSPRMSVLALVPTKCGCSPGQRSSIELWEKVLTRANIHLTFEPFETDRLHQFLYEPGHYAAKVTEVARACAARLRLVRRVESFDAVFIYREAALLGPAFLEKRIARRGKPIIYQLDDPLYVPYRSPANGYLSYLKCFGKIKNICRMSRVVIVNSTHIREFASRYNNNIWQIPCVVDSDTYSFQPSTAVPGPVRIGWSGSPTTAVNLAVVADALRVLTKRVEHRVHLIGGLRFDLPGIPYIARSWCADTEVDDLREIEVGMVPLPVNEWNRRKFYMKVVQYMALGIPSVCTPLGSNPEVIAPGVTGFLASTTSEWVEYLERLIRDRALRLWMAQNCAREAREKYSLTANADRIIAAFRAAA